MPEFDPYYRWLGIAPKDQPPNHYRLLGIDPFEEDGEVIAVAAKKQARHLRTFKTVSNAPTVQKLLDAVNVAFLCLTNPTEKQSYDDELRKMLAPKASLPVAEAIDSELAEIFRTPPASGASPIVKRREKKPLRFPLPSVVAIIAVVAGIVTLGLWLIFSQADKPSGKQTAIAGASKAVGSAAGTREPTSSVPRPSTSAASAAVSVATSATKDLTGAEPKMSGTQPSYTRTENSAVGSRDIPVPTLHGTATPAVPKFASTTEAPIAAKPASDSSSDDQTLPNKEKKAPVPSYAAQAESTKLLMEVFGAELTAAKTADQKKALAKKLLEKTRDTADDLANKYVLLNASRSLAVQAMDVEAAFEAIDQMANSFAVKALPMKVDVLTSLLPRAHLEAQHVYLAALALGLIDQALADEKLDTATQLGQLALDEARKTRNLSLLRQAQARQADIKQSAKAYDEQKIALATLEKTPDDPKANLIVGKYLCFLKGDWEKGISKLALGSDDGLKAVATTELKGPASASDRAKLGDTWWSLANTQKNSAEKKQFQLRAMHWYRQALPAIAGLEKDKIEKRLEESKDLEEVLPLSGAKLKELAEAPPLSRGAKGKWVLIFRSSDPSIWNFDSPDKNRFAIPLAKAPENIHFLKMQIDANDFVVIAMTKEKLGSTFSQDKVGWEGTNEFRWGGYKLGIYDRVRRVDTHYVAALLYEPGHEQSGWGFGYFNPHKQAYAWNCQPIERTIFEIYVTSSSVLTLQEKKQLMQ